MNLLRATLSAATGDQENMILERASEILQARYVSEVSFTSPQLVVKYLTARLEHLEHEEFHALFMDTQHKLIKTEVLAKGTIDGAAVYPREVLKAALKCNAAAVVFAHNHPSGMAEASQTDKAITEKLMQALKLVDIRTLDHIIIGHGEFQSFAEKGWI
tara:strand:- start:38513 stop:38989 length:477 start_codon:yes stop_codon:yes gene_type:complete